MNDHIPIQQAYFHSFELENIGAFSHRQELKLYDSEHRLQQWTLILGDNGTGKTTLLRALASMEIVFRNQRYFPRHNQTRDLWDYVRLSEKNRAKGLKLPRYAMIAYACPGGELGERFDPFPPGAIKITRVEDDIDEDHVPCYEELQRFRIYGYGATRRTGGMSSSEEAESFASRTLFDDESPLTDATDFMAQLQLRGHKESRAKRMAGMLSSMLSDLLPDVKARGVRLDAKGKRPVLEFETSDGWVPLRCLSLGYRALISWTVDMVARQFERYPDSENPLAEPAIALVDEIDLHLHPKFQRSLLDALTRTFPKTQFIASAHSPLIVQAASDTANIAVLKRDADGVLRIDCEPTSVRNWRIDQVLTSDLFGLESSRSPHVADLLAERRALLSRRDMTANDKLEAKRLESQIGQLPIGETPEEIKAMEALRQLAETFGGKNDDQD